MHGTDFGLTIVFAFLSPALSVAVAEFARSVFPSWGWVAAAFVLTRLCVAVAHALLSAGTEKPSSPGRASV